MGASISLLFHFFLHFWGLPRAAETPSQPPFSLQRLKKVYAQGHEFLRYRYTFSRGPLLRARSRTARTPSGVTASAGQTCGGVAIALSHAPGGIAAAGRHDGPRGAMLARVDVHSLGPERDCRLVALQVLGAKV